MGLNPVIPNNLNWSIDEGYKTFPCIVMSRYLFELLLRFVHFSNNKENNPNNQLCKIIQIMDTLKSNFKNFYNPEEMLCIDESLMSL